MRVLLDTNIIIHRETHKVIREDIGILFYWLDKLNIQKCIHPESIDEVKKHKDNEIVKTFIAKLKNYNELKTSAPEVQEILDIRKIYDRDDNDCVDTSLLKEVFCKRVDFLITEDRIIHEKANYLGVSELVYTIDDFLEKVTVENPKLTVYKVLSIKKEYFGNLDINDPFFDSLKNDYNNFEEWFNKKSDEPAYVCKSEDGRLLAFLYLKVENETEAYNDIIPKFLSKKRLKIGTFKVIHNGYKLGERFLKIIFDNALLFQVKEIYLTTFDKSLEQQRLINMLEDWGFLFYGDKRSSLGEEKVYVRDFEPMAKIEKPTLTYPYVSGNTRKFIVPIYPQYHTELFPDSILNTESPTDFIKNRPNRNAIRKVYISRSFNRDLKYGDIIVFYRTKGEGPAHYTSVTTTLGVVENVITSITNIDHFVQLCRKRSVFSEAELIKHWKYNPANRPFVVNFLYVYSFPQRINLKQLKEYKIIIDAPRGFEPISGEAFKKLMEVSGAEKRLIVN